MEALIIFADGTELAVEKNGDCYITANKPAFPADLSTVTVESEDSNREYHDAILVECASIDGRYWFAFMELSDADRATRQMQANIEYIAMMTDVDLEEA